MKKILGIISIFLIVVSCKKEVIERPDDLVPEETMEAMLFDLAIFNAVKSYNAGSFKDWEVKPSEHLYQKYGLDSLRYAKSSIYYASFPEEYSELYQRVEDRLTFVKDSINKIIEKNSEEKKAKGKDSKNRPNNKKSETKVKKQETPKISDAILEPEQQ